MSRKSLLWIGLLSLIALPSCISAYVESVGGEGTQVFEHIYATDFNTAWQAVLDSLKHTRLDVTNREGGFVQTRWTDNTAEKNFTDSFGSADSYLKAQYRVRVTVTKGFYNGVPTIKIISQKDQMIQRDVLEGWKPVVTDGIDEKSLLYRIGRLIYIRTKLARLEDERIKKELNEAPAQNSPNP